MNLIQHRTKHNIGITTVPELCSVADLVELDIIAPLNQTLI